MTTFDQAVLHVPADAVFVHRGRTERELDCVGAILLVYRLRGRPIDHLDRPYGELNTSDTTGLSLLMGALRAEFDAVPPEFPIDGDLLVALGDGQLHLGVVAAGRFWHMTLEGWDSMPLSSIMAYQPKCFRHRGPRDA